MQKDQGIGKNKPNTEIATGIFAFWSAVPKPEETSSRTALNPKKKLIGLVNNSKPQKISPRTPSNPKNSDSFSRIARMYD